MSPAAPVGLNGGFGVLIDRVSRRDLGQPDFKRQVHELWVEHGGLVAIRGDDLVDLGPEELVAWGEVFGVVDHGQSTARSDFMIPDHPILRIGNVEDENGKLRASFVEVPALESAADVRYNPETQRPVWHTDSVFRAEPPIGSAFHCKIAPKAGGQTLFADMSRAFAALDHSTRSKLERYEAICSYAHHDKKISLYSPGYPTLTPQERAANPPNRVPVVLTHPVSNQPALYGLNSSTCAVVERGTPISTQQLDRWDLEGIEDESVMIWRELLPFVTGPAFTVAWQWQPGDIVTWDNRSTMHAATGFDHNREQREMWRVTLLDRDGRAE